jgi:hypothetical protein
MFQNERDNVDSVATLSRSRQRIVRRRDVFLSKLKLHLVKLSDSQRTSAQSCTKYSQSVNYHDPNTKDACTQASTQIQTAKERDRPRDHSLSAVLGKPFRIIPTGMPSLKSTNPG